MSRVITLPFPPSVNHYWRHVVMGKRVATLISAPGRKYTNAVLGEVLRQKAAMRINHHVAVTIMLHAPDKRRRDVDNYAKSLLDSLVKANVLEDDSLIRDLRLVWGDILSGGKAVVMIREIAQPGQGGLL